MQKATCFVIKTETFPETRTNLSEYDYTCGAPVLPPNHNLAIFIQIRTEMSCISPIEVPHYSSGIGRGDLCAHCATEDSQCNMDLKKKYKTVLPLLEKKISCIAHMANKSEVV